MAILSTQISKALEMIEPSKDDKTNAPNAHREVRDTLTAADELKKWTLDPVLIGSYKRDVSIRRVKDVDVFCRMTTPDTTSGQEVLDEYFKVLDSAFGSDDDGNNRVKRQKRSLQVAFPKYDDLYVDVVPARERSDGFWEIPMKDSDEWQTTNPEMLTSLKAAMNYRLDDLYVPGVKLLRQTRRTILNSRPGGLFVELCFYDACKSGKIVEENQTTVYVTGLEAIAEYLNDKINWGKSLPDPTIPGQTLNFRATDLQWETASDKFATAAAAARAALEDDDLGRAAVVFRKLLGENGDGDTVFPTPAGYNDDGSKRTSAGLIVAGESSVPAGNGRFG